MRVITSLGYETRTQYDANGNASHVTDANAVAGLQPKNNQAASVYRQYDELNRLTLERDALNGDTRYTYDLLGNYLEGPSLLGAVKFKHLLLPLQIVLPIVAGYAGVGDGASIRLVLGAEHLRAQLRQVVAAMAARRVLGLQLARRFPAPQGRNRNPQRPRGLTYTYESFHIGEIGTASYRFQTNVKALSTSCGTLLG